MNENGDSKYRWNGDGLKCVVGETSTRIETSLRGYYPLGKDRLRRIVDLPGLVYITAHDATVGWFNTDYLVVLPHQECTVR